MKNEQFRDINLPNYEEELAVKTCINNAYAALDEQTDRHEATPDNTPYDSITITVNGIAHQFYLGAPQVLGLHKMMQHIAFENLYVLDENDPEQAAHIEEVAKKAAEILQQETADYEVKPKKLIDRPEYTVTTAVIKLSDGQTMSITRLIISGEYVVKIIPEQSEPMGPSYRGTVTEILKHLGTGEAAQAFCNIVLKSNLRYIMNPLTPAEITAVHEALDFVQKSEQVVFGAVSTLEDQFEIIRDIKDDLKSLEE